MADLTPLFQAAGTQYNVDPVLLRAMQQVEDAPGNPNAVGPVPAVGDPNDRAVGVMQIRMSNAKAAGIDPTDPAQAIPWAANTMAQNLARYNGNVEQAVAAYHGGTDQKNWGPLTQQYVSKVANAFGQLKQGAPVAAQSQQSGADPLLSMAQQIQNGQAPQGPPQAASDPLMEMAQQIAAGKSEPVPAPAAGGTGVAAPQAAAGQPQGQWQTPAGFVMGMGDAVRGGAQDLVHGLAWAANKIAPNSQFAQQANAALPQIQQTIDAQNAQYAAQRAANGGSGVDLARLAGNAVGTLPTAAIGPEYAGLSLLGKIALGATQGAAGAALMPVSPQDGQTFAGQKVAQIGVGGALGAVTPLALSGASALGQGLWNAAKPILQPGKFVGQGLAGAMDPAEAAAAAANIRSAQQFVPGSVPTTAQAAQTPVMVQTEKAAANDITPFKTAAMQRASDNNIARWQALMGVAQDPAALAAATQARAAAAQPLYDAAHQATANVGPAFMRYAQIPEMQEAMQRADALASLNSATGRGVAPVWPTPQSKTINGAALDYTSRALGDMIGEAQRTGATTRAGALTALKNSVDSWTNAYIPGVRQADAAYAAGSVPVNTMEAGQEIANKLGTKSMIPGIGGGVAELQLNPYRTALTNALGSQKFGIDPAALGTLQGIGQDLQRQSLSNSVKMGGSDTAYNIGANGWLARNLYGPNFQGATGLGKGLATATALLTGHPYVAAGVFTGANKVGKMVGSRLQDQLSGLLMNPDTVLPYLDARAAASANPVQNALAQRLLQYGRPTLVNGLSGSLINTPQQ